MSKAVLVVEDERWICSVVQAALQDHGYLVFTANDGQRAFETLETSPLDLNGLVTDIDLGDGPDGWEIASAARRIKPDLAVVYITAQSQARWNQNGVEGSLLIPKPFKPDQIALALQALL